MLPVRARSVPCLAARAAQRVSQCRRAVVLGRARGLARWTSVQRVPEVALSGLPRGSGGAAASSQSLRPAVLG
jgi:hypothetical protein